VKTYVMVAAGILTVGTACALAQETQPPLVPPVQASPPSQPPATPPPAPQVSQPASGAPLVDVGPIDVIRRREKIELLEGLLTAAVKSGAQETAREMQSTRPGLVLFTGMAKARGFFLEGYGVFFHVEIPAVLPSVASILESMERERLRQQTGQPSQASTAGPRVVDANVFYTEAVQRKLIDQMLEFRMDLRPDEWLTVAARDGDGPLPSGQISESITMILRIKGSDLADFYAGRITPEQVRRKVEVREF
jgi:hypothetical protein